MPIYEYLCAKCGNMIEVMQGINENPLKKCAECAGKLSKIISESSFVLKGTGWYKTDYASNNNKKTSASDSEKDSGEQPKTSKSPKCSACPEAASCN